MKTLKQLSLLGITTGLAVTLATLLEFKAVTVNTKKQPSVSHQTLIFPDLFSQLDNLSKIKITHANQSFVIRQSPNGWVIESEHDYPASFEKIKKLLWGISDLQIVSAKTKNPELLPELGLEDPKDAEATSTEIILENKDGKVLAGLITGKTQKSHSDQSAEALYMRKANESQAYLVNNTLPLEKSSLDWADRRLVHIEEKRIATIEVQNGPEKFTLTKKDPEQENFKWVNLPKDEEIASHFTVNNMASTLARLNFEHVQPAPSSSPTDALFKITCRTFDGLSVSVNVFSNEAKQHWATVQAQTVEPLPNVAIAFPLKKPEAVQKEAAQLQSQHRAWRYQIPAFQLEDLQKTKKDLVHKL